MPVTRFDHFRNEFSATSAQFTEASREHYAKLHAMPGAMHSGFAQFAAFDQDTIDNCAFLAAKGTLPMPVLANGEAKFFGTMMATVMRAGTSDVTEGFISGCGHWIMEENPAATVALGRSFLSKPGGYLLN